MSNLTIPRPVPVRTRSVSPRPCSSRRSISASPKSTLRSSRSFEPRRPQSAMGIPSEFSRKALTPVQMGKTASFKPAKRKAGSDKPVPIRPKAGSDVPVAIRARPKTAEQKISENTSADGASDPEEAGARHGYYVYVFNEKLNRSQGLSEGKPTASVRPIMFSMESAGSAIPVEKSDMLDLKPMVLNITPADSLETVLA